MTPKQEAALRLAREAMNLARAAHGQILLSDPPQEAWKAWGVSAALTKAMTAASEALAEQPAQPCGYPYCGCNSKAWCKVEQQSGIKQVIELYDSPEQPAQQQEPVAYIRKDQLQKAAQSPMLCEVTPEPRQDRIGIFTSPQSKPWVGLTDDDIQQVRENCGITHHAIKTIEDKLREKNA